MEKSVFTSTFLRIRDNLRTMAARIVGSREDAEDVLHDAFCKLWLNHRDLNSELSATRLSYAVVRNTAIDSMRRRHAHPTVDLDSPGVSNGQDTGDSADNQELYRALLDLSRRVLKPMQYEVFILHDVENLPYPEVAAQLGLTEPNVRQILSRARKQIREAYRNDNE